MAIAIESFIRYNGFKRIDSIEAMVQQLNPLFIDEDSLYPESDGKPLADNTTQFRLIVTIQGGLDTLFQDREDVFIAGDLFWYPVQLSVQQILEQKKAQRQAPDVMVVFGRPKGDRRSYKQWEEENIAPQVAFEILSKSNRKGEMEDKFKFYQQHGIEEYYLYDPKKNRLQGWLRKGKKLNEISQMEGWKSPRLGIKFSIASGDLALFYPNGEPFTSYVETAVQRDRQKQRADRERQEKEFAQQQRDRERERANLEKQRCDLLERDRLQTQAQLEEEQKKNQELRDRLRQMGIDL
ncbi:Uma2 family endonuclease [Spirulina sp. 06S082]|uniref:Uma2 family endonuclease n=2 Tax=unclassified Spirulina TaxID=2684457 RepID=UPI002B215615|nr:Uma2 family endonuclease [Spirulina sp. 06S082]MEA5471969.1 Uma2 family endonuclease [Spirulina sp. 06S082]